MAKRFFFACAGILCLALAYHLGATHANAQGSDGGEIKFVEGRGAHFVVVTRNDDIYVLDPEKLAAVSKGSGWTKFRLDAVK
jgi:hypothetical protein